jgi:hypothetical protein
VKGNLAGGTFSGSLDGTSCTALSDREQVCIDTRASLALTLTPNGPLSRYVKNISGWIPDGTRVQEHVTIQERAGVLTGTIDGQPIEPSTDGSVSTRDGHVYGDGNAPVI